MTWMRVTMVAVALLLGGAVAARAQNQLTAAVPATPDNAGPFLGEWTIIATGSYGNATVTLTLKVVEGKLVGEAEDTNGKHPLGDMSRSASSLVVYYAFDYQGMPIDAVITLTPNDKAVDAVLDFANGAAQFVGTATKK